MELLDSLLDDETLVRRPQARAAAVVPDHLELRGAYGRQLATLVVPDGQLAAVARHVPAGITLPVSVIISGGAGGLLGLPRRKLPGIQIVSAEPGLRDFDDLAGSAARVVSAAAELGSETAIFVELPYAPGWSAAVEMVEAAGLAGKIAADDTKPRETAEQLSILIEADLPFKVTSQSGSSWLSLLTAVGALIDGASTDDAAELIQFNGNVQANGNVQIIPPGSPGEGTSWSRIRRRVRRFGTDRVADVINEYAAWQSRGR
jgi:hypothetical protein